MPVKTSSDSNRWPSTSGWRNTLAWLRSETPGRPGMRGSQAASSSALARASAASAANARRQLQVSAISVPMGMPSTVAATMPKNTSATARPSREGPARCAAVSLAMAQNTGSARAGTKRATAIVQISPATAASALAAANSSRQATNSRLRSTPASAAVRNGPKAATLKANRLTSRPAWATLTWRSAASAGSRPTMTNSVVRMVKPAAASRRIGNSTARLLRERSRGRARERCMGGKGIRP